MSNDENNKAGGWFSNPLPIVMVVLLAAGVLVKNVPLESARPIDPERVKFVATSQQDVEARLWQDPFAAVEKYEEGSKQAGIPTANIPMMPLTRYFFKTPPAAHTPEVLHERIQALQHPDTNRLTIVAVSVFGGSFNEAAESRRRMRFAVVSALGFHDYHPENSEALGYFHIDLPESKLNGIKLTVPYEWFEKRDKSSNVLVLWLNEDKLSSEPLTKLQALIAELTPNQPAHSNNGLTFKLIGPAGSAMLMELVPAISRALPNSATREKHDPMVLESGSTLQVYAPGATISNCDLFAPTSTQGNPQPWDCFINSPGLSDSLNALPIIRTIGTDDVLSAALLWELWQRGVNREPWWKTQLATFVNGPDDTPFQRTCEDGLVLIGERDTEYGRTLLRYLTDGFSRSCHGNPNGNHNRSRSDRPKVRTFTYLRGLDGILPDIDKPGGNTPRKDDGGQSKDLRAQLKDAPSEHAEGRSQFDYLRRLADEIEQIDHKKQFAKNGVKAIGIVGSDLYDKLLILQALRSRFKDKIFFTTDLDARYLHADQKDWARNLVVASNFDLSLRPALQHSTLPFRDSYQTATYLAVLMALDNKPLGHWSSKMKEWLRPQIFEIGRTEAVHLASPSVPDLTGWINGTKPDGIATPATDTTCDDDWARCENIEPARPSWGLSLQHLPAILFMLCFGILSVSLASRRVQETVRVAYNALASPRYAERQAAKFGLIGLTSLVLAVIATIAVVSRAMDTSLAQGAGEPFVWLEGVSIWPSLVVRFIGCVTMLGLALAFMMWIQLQAHHISERFEFPLPQTWRLARSRWSAVWTGPHLDLASFDSEGKTDLKPAGATIEIVTLWQNYLRATRWREMAAWIILSMLLVGGLSFAAFLLFGKASFPHRGPLVETLHYILVLLNGPALWLVIFWVGDETRACARFIETLSEGRSIWPTVLLDREEVATGVPRAHLDDYLAFQLIVLATQRIHWLIYLPFVSILFMVLSRSDLFDTMDFPLALVFVTGLALAYGLYSAVLLRRIAESARVVALERYETRLLMQTRAKDSQLPAAADGVVTSPARWPISVEQIKILMERIRNTRDGAFAPIAQQPALQALLLPFGGYGSAQLIEYLINLTM